MDPLPRCCDSHPDWQTLGRHLGEEFAAVGIDAVAEELLLARRAVEAVDLGEDSLDMAERIARHRLMVRAGRLPDVARLDPERHDRQSA